MRFSAVHAAFLLAGLSLVAGWGDDWPRFLGPRGDGTSRETRLLKSLPASGPPVLWRRAVGAGYSAPSVLGNRLVLHHRQGAEEVLECLDADTGQARWRHAYPSAFEDPYGYNNGPRATPLLTPRHCYGFGAEGRLICLDLATGRLVWERPTGKDWNVPESFFGVGSSPVLDGSRLLVMVGGQPNAGMVAFDAATGRTLWESVGEDNWSGQPMLGWPGERTVVWRPHDKQASYATPALVTLHGRATALCLMRQGLVSLDPASGSVFFSRWFRAQVEESVNAANPVVWNDLILISSAYYRLGSVLMRVRPDGCGVDEVWRSTALEAHWATPILHGGHVYAFSGRNEPDARLRCVDALTGKVQWDRDERWSRRSQAQPPVFGRGSLILADDTLIALGEGGLLGLLRPDPQGPVELGRWQAPDLVYPCWTAPVLAHRRLYLRSESVLLCLDWASQHAGAHAD